MAQSSTMAQSWLKMYITRLDIDMSMAQTAHGSSRVTAAITITAGVREGSVDDGTADVREGIDLHSLRQTIT